MILKSIKMKKIILAILAVFIGMTEVKASDYNYLCLQKTDGSVAVISASGVEITVSGSTTIVLTVNDTDYNVSDLSAMWFTNTANGENIITIPSCGWATFCSASALNYAGTDGLTCYAATFNTSAATVSINSLSSAVPANTGVILQGDEGTYHVPVASSASAPSNNDLLGTTTALTTTSSYKYYALALDDSETSVGFKLVSTGVTIPACKAYYRCASSNAPTFFNMEEEGGTTAIDAVEVAGEQDNTPIYDLQGRLVQNPTKGIYIKNGKKIIIK